jgi:hypothetical protein
VFVQNNRQTVDATPLFFDSLFPSLQSTTPETVIADYRQRKRADSRAEHDGDDQSTEIKKFNGNNVEFYAEVIGKLIGTIRDGVTSLIDDVKQRKEQKNVGVDGASEVKSQKLTNHRANSTNVLMDVMEVHRNTSGTDTKQVTNESAPTNNISIATNEMMKGHREMKLTSLTAHQESNASESVEKENRGDGKIQSANESTPSIAWDEVVQVIARRTKHKRSNTNARQLEIPIDSDSSADGEMTNENGDDDESGQQATTADDNDAKWFRKHHKLFASLSQRHRMRKEKFVEFIHQFLTPKTASDTASIDNLQAPLRDDDDGDAVFEASDVDDDSNLSFAIMRGNSTIVNVSPKQFLQMFHRGSDEHEDFRLRTKTMLQRVFYRYARIYLKARKGYKEVRSFNRMAKEVLLENDESSTSSPLEFLTNELESYEELNDIDEDGENDGFMTSSARANFKAVEAFAILWLEIFGAIFGLTIGALSHLQGIQTSFIFDSFEKEINMVLILLVCSRNCNVKKHP